MLLPLLAVALVTSLATAGDPVADRALAGQPAAVADLAAIVPVCVASVRGKAGLPPGQGWQPGISVSGTPKGVAAMKRRDVQGMMSGMRYSNRVLYRSGFKGFVTRYFAAGEAYACQATIVTDAANVSETRRQIVSSLGLSDPGVADGTTTAFADQYILAEMGEVYRKDGSTFVIHADTAGRLPWDSGAVRPTISVIVF